MQTEDKETGLIRVGAFFGGGEVLGFFFYVYGGVFFVLFSLELSWQWFHFVSSGLAPENGTCFPVFL